jgi:hypothetical protein
MTGVDTTVTRSMGHLALYYWPGLEQAARALFTDIGCELADNGWAPGRDGFCTAVFDGPTANHSDNLVYLSKMHEEQVRIEKALAGTLDELGMGASWGDISESPEIRPHFGIRFHTMEALEGSLMALERDASAGGPLDGHVKLLKFRARPGLDVATDSRMAASPAFRGDEKPGFADYLVQCFVRTDLFGNLTSAGLIELDYAFPPFFARIPTFG